MERKDSRIAELRKATGLLPSVTHARAKASAAMHGVKLQEWVAQAIQEKLDREDRAKKAAGE